MTRLLTVAVVLAMLVNAWALWILRDDKSLPTELGSVETWDYQLQKLDPERLAASTADMLVIDYSRNGRHEAAFKPEEVERLKVRPDGRRRPVVAYLSVGEAEEYRFYWRAEWKTVPPSWLFEENCRWPGNHLVRYWQDGWKDIVYRGDDSYLARIVAAGFDGVYLDRIDAYWDLRHRYPGGKAEATRLVIELAQRARALNPGFLVIAQNAEGLLADATYRDAINAIAKEDLLHGVQGTGTRNTAQLIDWSVGELRKLASEKKPVFVVEYLTTSDAIARTGKEISGLGFIPTFPTRALDGGDPVQQASTAQAATSTTPAAGTPEFHVKHCKAKEETKS